MRRSTTIALTLAFVLAGGSATAEIRVASWNLNNLHQRLGEPLRPGAPIRSVADIETLLEIRDRIAADIVALQEVNGPRAAHLVFPPAEWDVVFSGRYADDLVTGRETDRIYTGFAIRRGVFEAVTKRDVAELSVIHADQRPTRWGTEILVEKDGQALRLLSLHLKSSCHAGSLEPPSNPHCITLAAQRAPLEAWIDAAAMGDVPFAILGDWNRRFDVHGDRDHIWQEIDDGDPPGLNLWRLPFERDSRCESGFTDPIDFLVFDDRVWPLVNQASFAEVLYGETWDPERRTPSDHCPIAVTLDWPASADRAAVPEALSTRAAMADQPPLTSIPTLDPDQVTVSGISSGGFFAHQFHVAYSELVTGAGVMAGGPYACAEQTPSVLAFNPLASVIVATGVCTRQGRWALGPMAYWLPAWPDVDESIDTTMVEHQSGRIDDPANLANDRAWLFVGAKDEVVPLATLEVLRDYYLAMGLDPAAVQLDQDPDANHGVPIEEFTGETDHAELDCDEYGLPFLIDCDFDAAERLLRHLYPVGFNAEPGVAEPGRLIAFDQTEFFDTGDPRVSMGEVGFVYVPADCAGDEPSDQPCRLHVAFHGCRQYQELVGDDFYWDAGYNAWAEANRIVVLYPQVTAWDGLFDVTGITANPKGCWDWWGYSGLDYFRQSGKQMQAVKEMIDRLLSD
jgi:poly(3-hydroxybutyrate) depolymerase